jgi:hypothetical protein
MKNRMTVQNEYKNLTSEELVFADHYAETGNTAGLREMRERSSTREKEYINAPHHTLCYKR